MNILITGGAGFIGSNTLRYFYNKYPDYNFIVLDALTYAGDIKNIPEEIHKSDRFKFWYGDVRNAKLVEHLVGMVDAVIHFAAETHVARSIYDDSNFFETDVLGTQRIANAVLRHKKKIKRFIHISTSEVYGTALRDVMDEDHPLNPQSPYAAAKAGADRLVHSYVATYDIPAVIVRPFNMYGPNQHLEKLIPRFITCRVLNEPMTIHGTGESKRDFTYVEDLARALDLVLHADDSKVKGHVFNVGASHDYSVNEIAEKITRFIKSDEATPDSNFTEYTMNIGDRPGQVFRHTAGTQKVQDVLGWKPTVNFDEGLRKTVEWYKANEPWWRAKMWMRHVPIETEDGKVEWH